jgi:N-methylhydantoinase B/oxoprolinase/acetone carboxylase alpha subunit
MNNVAFGGYNPLRKRSFAYYETIGGGMGAGSNSSGISGVHTHMTNSLNTPLESLENYLPLKISKYCLRKGSGGQGQHSGGEGIIREYEFLVPAQVTIISERRKFSPYGLQKGKSGKTGKNTLFTKGKKIPLKSKCNFNVQPGDLLRVETPGGGGYGSRK